MARRRYSLDILKDIILLYANTKPDPVENLLEIHEVLKNEFADQEGLALEAFNYYRSEVLRLIIELNKIGPQRAEEILNDERKTEAFISDIFSPYCLGCMEEFKRYYDTAFSDIFGYLRAHRCPCSFIKWDFLEKEGFIETYGNYREEVFPHWIKERPNCLQCDHIHFVALLRDLMADKYDLLTDISKGYRKASRETIILWFSNNQLPLEKLVIQSGYEENKAAFPGYLNGLPCNVLVDMLSSGNYAKKIKECPICGKFFFAEDTKRKICYEPSCFTEYKRRQKQRHRQAIRKISLSVS